jgi:hypothetical protein
LLLLVGLTSWAGFHKYLVVHAPLNNQQTRCNEGLLKKLGLKHFDQVLYSKFLGLLGILHRRTCLVAIVLGLIGGD